MTNRTGCRIIFDSLGPLIFVNTRDPQGKAISALEGLTREIEDAAQANAPWTDRTGDARAGLTCEVDKDGEDVILELFHTVDYGQWLETIQSGRFAIIMPTLEEYSDRIFQAVNAERSIG